MAKKIAIDEISYVNLALDAPEAVYPPLRSKLSSEEDSSHIWAGIVSGNAKSDFNFK